MRELKHSYVDILKIDVEGAEWEALEAELAGANPRRPRFGHLLLEIHMKTLRPDGGPGLQEVPTPRLFRLLESIEAAGYVMYAMEINNLDCNWGVEFGWVHASLVDVPVELASKVPLVPWGGATNP